MRVEISRAVSADRPAWAVAAAVTLTHFVTAIVTPYGFFRDELYFVDCGRHPAFGYVDQPPLVPLVAAASQLVGRNLLLLRALPAFAHGATVLVAAALAKLVADAVGETSRAPRTLAAIAVAVAPMLWGLEGILNTTAFEPLAWTFVAYAAARVALLDERRWLVALGAVTGVALEAKYAIPFFLAPLIAGIAVGPSRRLLVSREALVGAALAALLAAPSAIWQATHGLPFLELMKAGSHGKNVVVAPGAFVANQIAVMNPVLAPLWMAGPVWALVEPRLARVRFLAVAFLGLYVEMIALHGKDYYVAPVYGVGLALGAVGAARLVRSRVALAVYATIAVALFVVALPLCAPVLPPPTLAAFVAATHLGPPPQEVLQRGVVLPPLMADMLGWKELEERVADAWRAVPEAERARTTIVAGNYGEACAINLYGPDDALPRAVSGHNALYGWGPGASDPVDILRVGGDPEAWKDDCNEISVPARFGGPYVMPYERDRAIVLCRGVKFSLREQWPTFKHLD
jgi:hypothetical protein